MMYLIKRPLRRRRERREAAEARASASAADFAGASPAARGTPMLLAHQARYDLLASFRNPRARFFTFVFPIMFLVIFAGVFGDHTTVVSGVRVSYARFYVPGIMAMSIITAAYGGLVVTIASARESGVLKRRRATPVPAAILIGGQALSTLITATIMVALLLAIARIFYGVGFAPGALGAIAVTVVLGTLAFACLGYAVAGLVGSPDAAQPIVQVTMMPLYFISGVWIPNESLPLWLRRIAEAFPIEHLAAALHLASVRSSFGDAFAPADLLWLAAWAAAAAVFAARRFSWLPLGAHA